MEKLLECIAEEKDRVRLFGPLDGLQARADLFLVGVGGLGNTKVGR